MSDDRPNILVMLSDDHAQWALGAYGNQEIHSPGIDWLAENGTIMQNAMTLTPVCSPARASFWTGRYPSQHGIHDYLGPGEYRDGPWLDGEVGLGELLSGAGYRCGFFGKWHCGEPERTRPGFDNWHSIGRRTGPHYGEQEYWIEGEREILSGYQSRITTDAALSFLMQDDDRPFFAFVGLVATHSPYDHHAARHVDRYRKASFMDIPSDPTYRYGRLTGEGMIAGGDWRPRQMQYYAAVSEIDEQLGRIIDLLDERGQLENTLIVYTSDHGLNAGHHGLFGKGNATRPLNMFEESIRIPMIFGGWNGICPHQRRNEFVDHTDLFATILEIAGAQVSDERHYPGRSFASQLCNAQSLSDWKQIQVGEYGDLRMARSKTHKLIVRHGRGADELYDLEHDPRELRNGFEDPRNKQAIGVLTEALAEAFAPMEDSPRSGLLVADLRAHNSVEAWRGEPE
jgi:arylsulfatase A-like enzyme